MQVTLHLQRNSEYIKQKNSSIMLCMKLGELTWKGQWNYPNEKNKIWMYLGTASGFAKFIIFNNLLFQIIKFDITKILVKKRIKIIFDRKVATKTDQENEPCFRGIKILRVRVNAYFLKRFSGEQPLLCTIHQFQYYLSWTSTLKRTCYPSCEFQMTTFWTKAKNARARSLWSLNIVNLQKW